MEEDPVAAELRALEERLLQPEFRRDRLAVSALLADDFVEYGSSGRVFDKHQILDILQTEQPRSIRLADFAVRRFCDSLFLVTYRSLRGSLPWKDGPPAPGAAGLHSSLWVRREGRWQIAFHQGTRIPERTGHSPSVASPAQGR